MITNTNSIRVAPGNQDIDGVPQYRALSEAKCPDWIPFLSNPQPNVPKHLVGVKPIRKVEKNTCLPCWVKALLFCVLDQCDPFDTKVTWTIKMKDSSEVPCLSLGDRQSNFDKFYPMYVMPVHIMKKLPSIICHEQALQNNLLVEALNYDIYHEEDARGIPGALEKKQHHVYPVLNMKSGESHFIAHPRSKIVFISHCWSRPSLDPSQAHPDNETGQKFQTMKQILADFDYVWFDFWSIPQRSSESQMNAINSLPAYVSSCTALYSMVDAKNPAKYFSRGWTNLEMVVSKIPVLESSEIFKDELHLGEMFEVMNQATKEFVEENAVEIPSTSDAPPDLFPPDLNFTNNDCVVESICKHGFIWYNSSDLKTKREFETKVSHPLSKNFTNPDDGDAIQSILDLVEGALKATEDEIVGMIDSDDLSTREASKAIKELKQILQWQAEA